MITIIGERNVIVNSAQDKMMVRIAEAIDLWDASQWKTFKDILIREHKLDWENDSEIRHLCSVVNSIARNTKPEDFKSSNFSYTTKQMEKMAERRKKRAASALKKLSEMCDKLGI